MHSVSNTIPELVFLRRHQLFGLWVEEYEFMHQRHSVDVSHRPIRTRSHLGALRG